MSLKWILVLVALAHMGLGLFALFWPDKIADLLFGVKFTEPAKPAAHGEIRAVYGGLFFAVGAIILLGTLRRREWLLAAGLGYAGLSVGRVFSLYLDGAAALTIVQGAVEVALTVLLAYGARKLRAAPEAG